MYIKGIEKIWFISDDFGSKSYAEHYFQWEPSSFQSYALENYECSGLISSSASLNTSFLSRIRNSFISGIADQTTFPKLVVLVLDDELIDSVVKQNDTSSYTIGKVLHWLMSELDKSVRVMKEDYLLNKSKRANEPHFLWIEVPFHYMLDNNELREKFNTCLRNISQLHQDHSVLALKKVCDSKDSTYFTRGPDTIRFTASGWQTYWEAVGQNHSLL